MKLTATPPNAHPTIPPACSVSSVRYDTTPVHTAATAVTGPAYMHSGIHRLTSAPTSMYPTI